MVVANLGVMHHIPGACNDEGGWSQGLALFKSILSEWLGVPSVVHKSPREREQNFETHYRSV